MKFFAVIDTNVIVSAMLKWQSVPGNVMSKVFDGTIIPVLNDEILFEYKEVLSRPKFHFAVRDIEDFLNDIEERCLNIDANRLDIELIDPKDQVFYEVVMEKRKVADAYLVTGNIKHFPDVSFIVTPREMLNIIEIQ